MPRTHRGDEVAGNHGDRTLRKNNDDIPFFDLDYRHPSPVDRFRYPDYEPERLISVRGKLRGERLG